LSWRAPFLWLTLGQTSDERIRKASRWRLWAAAALVSPPSPAAAPAGKQRIISAGCSGCSRSSTRRSRAHLPRPRSGLAFEFILPDIVKRPYITAGMTAFTLMVPLAVTSTKGWIRRLGRKWQLLHRLVYVSAVAASLHFLWKVKVAIGEPVYYAVILGSLLAFRLF
jgi:hypothetical protein